MRIWKNDIDLKTLNDRSRNSLSHYLGIEYTEIGDDYLKAIMPVDHKTLQPFGILHGGANCALAETVASAAANFCIDNTVKVCVGIQIQVNHIKAVKSGIVMGVAKPHHLGKSTHVWEIKIFNDENRLSCTSTLTLAVIDKS